MASATKEYKIVINGLTESVSQVKALSSSLDALKAKIDSLKNQTINVTSNGNSGGNKTSELDQENKLLKQIEATERKISETRSDDYKELVRLKDELKQIKKQQDAAAASAKLMNNEYSRNTMAGMKEELKDILRVMDSLDVDSNEYKQLNQDAKELQETLRDLEAARSSFGRNVGNYQSAVDGFDKLKVAVGGTVYEFNSLRDAETKLKNNLGVLIHNNKENTEQYQELEEAITKVIDAQKKLNSAIGDAKASSQTMDNMLDTFESIAAFGNAMGGIRAFFGFDDAQIQKSIQRLVALQSVLQGIEKIRQQMDTGEGLGKIFSIGSDAVDKFVAKLTGAKVTTEGLTKSSKAATTAVRLLSSALKMIGIGVITAVVTSALAALQKLSDEQKNLIDTTDILNAKMTVLNNTAERKKDMAKSDYIKGLITDEEYLSKVYAAENNYLKENIRLWERRSKMDPAGEFLNGRFRFENENGGYDYKSNLGLFSSEHVESGIKDLKDLEHRFNQISLDLTKDSNIWEKAWEVIAHPKLNKRNLATMMGNDIIVEYVRNIQKINLNAKDAEKDIRSLYHQMEDSRAFQEAMANIDKIIPNEKVAETIKEIVYSFNELGKSAEKNTADVAKALQQLDIDTMNDRGLGQYAKQRAELNKQMQDELMQYEHNAEVRDKIQQKYDKLRADVDLEETKAIRQAQNEISNYRIQAMKEGLAKQLAQLNQEKKERIQQAQETGIAVGEKIKAIQELYNAQTVEAEKEWAEQMTEAYNEFWENIANTNFENAKANFKTQLEDLSKLLREQTEQSQDRNYNGVDTSYPLRYSLRDKTNIENILGVSLDDQATLLERYNEIMNASKTFYNEVLNLQTEYYNKSNTIQQESLTKQEEADRAAEDKRYNDLLKSIDKQEEAERDGLVKNENYEKKKNEIRDKYRNLYEAAEKAHINKLKTIEDEHRVESEKNEKSRIDGIQQSTNDYFQNNLEKYREFYNQLTDLANAQPILHKSGFINIKATRKNYQEALEGFRKLLSDVDASRDELIDKFNSKQLTLVDMEKIKAELAELKKQIIETSSGAQNKQKEEEEANIDKIMSDVSMYTSYSLQTMSSIFDMFWAFQDAAYEKEMEQIDKDIEALEKKLDKQKEIVEKYANDVNSIEDELATARGDRRQELIDDLNSQKAAERDALAEQKRLEREKEKLEQRQEALEEEQRRRQHDRDVAQAIVNAAMAVSFALANHWPMPAIALASMAAIQGAAQVAAVKAQKFASGGIIEGKSHAAGGVKVLGGAAEVEGGEFITNKYTTAKNAQLLEFINGKKKKIYLEDMIDFYTDGRMKRNIISASPNRRYADGGQLPTLRTDININNRILDAIESVANRPSYVSVTEIEDVSQSMRSVRAQAGLSE